MAIDHTNCTHPRTPAGRRACRAGKAFPLPADTGVNAVYNDYIRASVRKTRISHKNCNHAETSHANRQCRADREFATRTVGSDYIGEHIRKTAANGEMKARMDREAANAARSLVDNREIRMTGAVARRMARQAVAADNVRIQPGRSGARVSARNTSCVQAALHIDAHGGSCACGWKAKVQ